MNLEHRRELVLAVAQGRLALAEVAVISGEELDAIYETAVMRLDTGRNAEGARMLAALVVLYPFAVEYWRAYGVALERLGELVAAQRAYAMARALAPDTTQTLAHELLGEHGATEPTNPSIDGRAPEATATDVLSMNIKEPTQTSVGPSPETTDPHIDATSDMTGDTTQTALPSRTSFQPTRSGATLTIRPAPLPKEAAALMTWPVAEEPTASAATASVKAASRKLVGDRSVTAIVDRRPRPIEIGGDTARIDRRTRRPVTGTSSLTHSVTALVRRRNGLPLGEDV